MYQLYGCRLTRSMIVQMVLAEGSIEYKLRQVDIFNDEHRSPEFLALNPAGFVPVLIKPNGEVVYETPAINLYLADHHRLTHLAPAIDEPERSRFLSGLFFLSDDLEPALKQYFYPQRYVLRDEDESEMRRVSLQRVLDRMAVIEQQLQQNGPYQLGSRFSLIDIILCFWAEYLNSEQALGPCPAIRRCLGLVMNRPRLRPLFDELIESRTEHLQKQTDGEGAE